MRLALGHNWTSQKTLFSDTKGIHLFITTVQFSPLSIELVSWSCCNIIPQTGRLRTKGTCSLTVLEAGSPKSRCQQSAALSRFWIEPFLAFSQLLVFPAILGVLRLIDVSLQPLPLSSQALLLLSCSMSLFFLQGRQSYQIKVTLLQCDFILTNYICKDSISKQVTFSGTSGQDFNKHFEGTEFNLSLIHI